MGSDISYNKLFKRLIDLGFRKTRFAEMANISPTTMAKLSNNQYVSMKVLIKICRSLNCSFDDIMEILPEKKLEEEQGKVEVYDSKQAF